MKRRFFAALMALIMVLAMLPATALATEGETSEPTYVAFIDADNNGVQGEGETGYTTLAAAIAAAADAATIQLLPGTIEEYVAPWIADSKHTCEKSITIKGAENFSTIMTGGLYLGYDDSQTRDHTITVEGIAFKNKGLVVADQKCVTIKNNTFGDIDGVAILVMDQFRNGAEGNATITGNVINGATTGVEARRPHDANISNNQIVNVATNAILVSGASKNESEVFGDITITGNTLTNWGASTTEGRAVRVTGGTTVTVTGNEMTCTNPPEEHIKITATNSVITVSGNTMSSGAGILLENAVAKIGDVYYPTLQAAITAATDGQTVTLLKDVNLNGVRLDIDKNITLDLNGYTLTSMDGGKDNWMAVYINEGKTFTLVDSSDAQTGKIVSSCYGVYVKQNATFNLESGTIQVSGNGTYDLGVVVWNGAFNMTGGQIDAQVGVYTSEYYAKNGSSDLPDSKVSIINGTINVSGDYPDFVVSDGVADITISGGSFTGGNEWTGVWQYLDKDEDGDYDDTPYENKVITGGTFSTDPTDYLAAGYVVNGSGPYTVSVYVPPYVPPVETPTTPTTPEIEAPSVDTSAPVVDSATTENADGSITKTETLENGAVVETTTNADGSSTSTATKTETVETEDSKTTTTTTTTTNTDASGATVTESKEEVKVETATGTTTTTTTVTESETKTEKTEVKEETVVAEDGTETTTTTSTTETALADGSTGTTTVDETGKVEAEVVVSDKAVAAAAAAGTAVELAMPAVEASTDSNTAATVTVSLPAGTTSATVAIPVAEGTGSGAVAVIVNADGTETVVTQSVVTENGLEVEVPDGAVVKVVDNSTGFDDVHDAEHWSEDAVDFASSRELLYGTGDNQFSPDATTTRGMVFTVIARYAGQDTTAAEGQHWQEPGTEWATQTGVSDGTDPDANVTREQLVTMLWRYAGAPAATGSYDSFADAGDVSEWAQEAMAWAVEQGIINGKDDAIAPQDEATRAEFAQMLKTFCIAVN